MAISGLDSSKCQHLHKSHTPQAFASVPETHKQDVIIKLCEMMYLNPDLSNTEIVAEVAKLKPDTGSKSLFAQEINRSTIYAWVSVYACRHLGSGPYTFEHLCTYIKERFGFTLPTGDIARQYFSEIQNKSNVDIRTISSYGGATYTLPKIRDAWKIKSHTQDSAIVQQIATKFRESTIGFNPQQVEEFLQENKPSII